MTITFTLGQLVGGIVAICAGIGTVSGAIVWICKGVKAMRAPDERQNERITAAEERLKEHDELFDNDNKRLKDIEKQNRILLRSMMALFAHNIDGNHMEPMEAAKKEIEDYLVSK